MGTAEPCGRCRGPAASDGAWCNRCIIECRDYTQQLDLQQLPELNTEPLSRAAIHYAKAGIPVFPLTPDTKIPLVRSNGVHDATTDTGRFDLGGRTARTTTSASAAACFSTYSMLMSRTASQGMSH
jgi:hypothetical protein